MKTIKTIFQEITKRLTPHYGEQQARVATLWLLEKLTRQSNAQLMTNQEALITDSQTNQLHEWVRKLTQEQYPLQYLLGTVQFGSLTLAVRPPTLIPRPETEEWVAHLITLLRPYQNEPLTILDMCTGSGCIALWLAHEFPRFTLHAVDICSNALQLAQENAALHAINNVVFYQSDCFADLPSAQRYDMILSNPPYITEQEYEDLAPTVKLWEDKDALVAANNGLAFYERLAQKAPSFLTANSVLKDAVPRFILEIGDQQAKTVQMILETTGWGPIALRRDLLNNDRTLWAYRKDFV